jgi:hypothetical protein
MRTWTRGSLGLLASVLIGACRGSDPEPGPPTTSADGGSSGCAAGEKPCHRACVRADDPMFGCAGESCLPCASAGAANAAASCDRGACATACLPGFSDCDANKDNGCETNTGADPENCGACGNVCGAQRNNRACQTGTCAFNCQDGFAHCGTDDATGCDTAVGADRKNCGQCGRDCLGRACGGGECAITELGISQPNPAALAVDGTYVYVARGQYNASGKDLVRLKKDGTTTNPPPLRSLSFNPASIATNGTDLFWAEDDGLNPAKVWRINADGSGPAVEAGQAEGTSGGSLAIVGSRALWANARGVLRIQSTALDGTGVRNLALSKIDGMASGAFIGADAANVYWAGRVAILTTALDAARPCYDDAQVGAADRCRSVVTENAGIVAMATDDDNVYFATLDGAVRRAPKTPGGVTTIATLQGTVGAFATDGLWVYWSSTGGVTNNTLRRQRASATESCVGVSCPFVANATSVSQILVDAEAVYWAERFPSGYVKSVGKWR